MLHLLYLLCSSFWTFCSWEEDYLPTSKFTKGQNTHTWLRNLSLCLSGIKEYKRLIRESSSIGKKMQWRIPPLKVLPLLGMPSSEPCVCRGSVNLFVIWIPKSDPAQNLCFPVEVCNIDLIWDGRFFHCWAWSLNPEGAIWKFCQFPWPGGVVFFLPFVFVTCQFNMQNAK